MTSSDNIEIADSEFAFMVIKAKDGRYAIANVNNEQTARQPGLDDVYTSLATLQRDIDRQSLALAVVGALQQYNGGSTNQSASGLVVPQKKFVKRS